MDRRRDDLQKLNSSVTKLKKSCKFKGVVVKAGPRTERLILIKEKLAHDSK